MEQPNPGRSEALTDEKEFGWLQRRGLLLVAFSPIAANLIGSIFNIIYNQIRIEPFLSDAQMDRFHLCWKVFNLVVYPLAIAMFLVPIIQLNSLHRRLLRRETIDSDALFRARRKVINLPWWFLAIVAIGWLSCIPVFLTALNRPGDPLPAEVSSHLVTSFLIAALIAVTQSFFAVEMATQAGLMPVFFQDTNPARFPAGFKLGIGLRGALWAIASIICPVISLMLLLVVRDRDNITPWFGAAVGLIAIAFGLVTTSMLARWVAVPITRIHKAAGRIERGDYTARVNLPRSDAFGLLIERFNQMVEGLAQRENLQATFGRHVGTRAAKRILAAGDTVYGQEQELTIMFLDVRDFTSNTARLPAEDVVGILNEFFAGAVATIEQHGGMVNKFLGDGLMAIFGTLEESESDSPPMNHASKALEAATELQSNTQSHQSGFALRGWSDFSIGIGIHTGPAIIGCIGSPRRMEYTAIGDTVNIAARIESLTSKLATDTLCSDTTARASRTTQPAKVQLKELEPQMIKGKQDPILVHDVS